MKHVSSALFIQQQQLCHSVHEERKTSINSCCGLAERCSFMPKNKRLSLTFFPLISILSSSDHFVSSAQFRAFPAVCLFLVCVSVCVGIFPEKALDAACW